MTPEERAKAIRSNRRAYGLEPGTGYRSPRPAPARRGYYESRPKSIAVLVRPAKIPPSSNRPAPPKYLVLIAGIPAVSVGARMPGERRLKRKKR